MDFYQIREREAGTARKPVLEIYPEFKVFRSEDLMVRGKSFYAIWDEEAGLWSTDEFDVQRLVDKDLHMYKPKTEGYFPEVHKKLLGNFSSNSWLQFRNYVSHLTDNSTELDTKLTFRNTPIEKHDFRSKRLPYDLTSGDISAWDELVNVLYDEEERQKIEWMIGSVIAGDSINIQKFFVFYGAAGTGKGTIIKVIEWLFDGYVASFNARELTGANNAFALEAFKSNPLVAIDPDGDMSKIQDNTKLNALVSHEYMLVNEKNKPQYRARFNALTIIGSNSPVKITDAKSGLIRRLIDIQPTGDILGPRKYQTLMNKIQFELGAIAQHCLEVYLSMGKDFYSGYQPVEMMLQTDVFFNFIEAYYDVFSSQEGITLRQAYVMYKSFCEETGIEHVMAMYKMREELKAYFEHFEDRAITTDGERVRSWYTGFNAERFKQKDPEEKAFSLVMDSTVSLIDELYSDCPAQYSKEDGTPQKYWTNEVRTGPEGKEFTPKASQVVSTKLKDIDTSREHYVKIPENHIVIDFDLSDAEGNKSLERNLEAASTWPPTYAELSKSGKGVHLHYVYKGDVSELSRLYDDGIEVKVFTGNSSLRRRLSGCNNVPMAEIASGLPLKEKKVMNEEKIMSEKGLRDLIIRNLRKEIHPNTKPSVDFIHKILEDAYNEGMVYDVTDLRGKILNFAQKSRNQPLACIKLVQTMKFKSEALISEELPSLPTDEREVIFDTEVFPNLFVLCWKYDGDPDDKVTKLVNPSPTAIEKLMSMKLVGFNCRNYDNHIIYAAYQGYSNQALYELSKKLIDGVPNSKFGAAYNISYTDIFDFASKKQGLKKWQIELGIHHMEVGIPWDEPVPKEKIPLVVEYCTNDVNSTEKVKHHLKGDYIARQILAELSGLSMNHTTNQHTTRIMFGEEKNPQSEFVYTNLSDEFPGYEFDKFGNKSSYRGEDPSEGGYVYAEPGIHHDVALLDVTSLHPTTIEQLNIFGKYTEIFSQLKRARVLIKRGELDEVKKMFGGRLARFLDDPEMADALGYALKIVINSVYGLTAARFDNAFRDPRNIDNIVAKRGALFMIDLKYYVQSLGYQVVHIKTDSIKIANATKEIIDLVMEFGQKYGYEFEHEETYDKMALVNDAVYVAKTKQGKQPSHWTATGTQFKHPYVFKTMFTHEPIKFEDKCEERHVKSVMYLDFSHIDEDKPLVFDDLENRRRYIGRDGLFCPIEPGYGGGKLVRHQDGKDYAVTGTSGYFWLESEVVKNAGLEAHIDMSYFQKLVDDAYAKIGQFGDAEEFVS